MNNRYQKGEILSLLAQGIFALGLVLVIIAMITAAATPTKFSVLCTLNNSTKEFIGYDVYVSNRTIIFFTESQYVRNVYNMNDNENCSFTRIK